MFLHCPFVKFPLLVICSAIVLAALGLKGHFGEMGEKRVYVPLLVMFQDLPLRGGSCFRWHVDTAWLPLCEPFS